MRGKNHRMLGVWVALVLWAAGCPVSGKKKATPERAATPSVQVEDRHFTYYFDEGVRALQRNDLSQARDLMVFCYTLQPENGALAYELSRIFAAAGDIGRTQYFASEAVKADPDNYWYGMFLAQLKENLGDVDGAIALYQDISKRHPKEEAPYTRLIALSEKKHDYTAVIGALDGYEQISGVSEDISKYKYSWYMEMQKEKEAERELDKLIAHYPENNAYRVSKGDHYRYLHDYKKATAVYEDVLTRDPENGGAQYGIAECLRAQGDSLASVEKMRIIMQSKTIDFETQWELLGRYMDGMRETDENLRTVGDLLETLKNTHPDVAEAQAAYAGYLLNEREVMKAASLYEHVVDLKPEMSSVYLQLYSIYRTQGANEKALETVRRAREALPEETDWVAIEASTLHVMGRTDEAVKCANEGVEIAKNARNARVLSDLYGVLGDAAYAKNDYKEAERYYDRAIVANPTNTYVLNNYSYLLADQNTKLDDAEQMIKRCLKLTPGSSQALDTYAWVLFRQGHPKWAKQYIEEALQNEALLDEERAVLLEHYGDILTALGEKAAARAAYKEAYDRAPSDALAKKLKE